MMTKKNYENLARIISFIYSQNGTLEDTISETIRMLKTDNPKFDEERFRDKIEELMNQ